MYNILLSFKTFINLRVCFLASKSRTPPFVLLKIASPSAFRSPAAHRRGPNPHDLALRESQDPRRPARAAKEASPSLRPRHHFGPEMSGKQQGMGEGMPPSKQQQHEEALAPLDDQERRAVQKRLMRRNHGSGASHTSRSTARDRFNDPSFAKGPASSRRSARGVYTARSAMTTSRSMMTTARSSSPTGRYHPDPTRRLELRKVRPPAPPLPSPVARLLAAAAAPYAGVCFCCERARARVPASRASMRPNAAHPSHLPPLPPARPSPLCVRAAAHRTRRDHLASGRRTCTSISTIWPQTARPTTTAK